MGIKQAVLEVHVPSLDVEIKDLGIVDKHGKRTLSQRDGTLTKDLVQNCTVFLCKGCDKISQHLPVYHGTTHIIAWHLIPPLLH